MLIDWLALQVPLLSPVLFGGILLLGRWLPVLVGSRVHARGGPLLHFDALAIVPAVQGMRPAFVVHGGVASLVMVVIVLTGVLVQLLLATVVVHRVVGLVHVLRLLGVLGLIRVLMLLGILRLLGVVRLLPLLCVLGVVMLGIALVLEKFIK